MIDLNVSYPIATHPTWNIFDSSKIVCAMSCLRKYFFRYMLGWKPCGNDLNLIHGEAWHRCQEVVFRNNFNPNCFKQALNAYNAYYSKFYSPTMALDNTPKCPAGAELALTEYLKSSGIRASQYEVIDTEIGGQVLISDDIYMAFRLDVLAKRIRDGKIIFIDHKTSGSTNPLYGDFGLSMQMSTYLHATMAHADNPSDVWGGVIERAIFSGKNKINITLSNVPFFKTPEYMESWLFNANRWVRHIMYNTKYLLLEKPSDVFMKSFGIREVGCKLFNKMCPYRSLCDMPNPLQQETVPLGFEIEFWNPLKREAD